MDDIIQNINNVCRLCLCEDANLVSIFEDSSTLSQKIVSCVNVEVNISDRMSTMICKLCLGKVDEWYDFKKCCEDVQFKLRQWANSLGGDKFILGETMIYFQGITIKEEPIDTDDTELLIDTSMCIKSEPPDSLSPNLSDNEERVDFEYDEMPILHPAISIETNTDDLLIPSLECPVSIHSMDAPFYNNTFKQNDREHISGSLNQENHGTVCRICNKEFSNYYNRNRHERNMHSLEKELSITAVRSLRNDPLEEYNHLPEMPAEDNSSETSNVTIEQFAASLQLIQTSPVATTKATISEKEFAEFNKRIVGQIERERCDCCDLQHSPRKIVAHLRKTLNIPNYSCFWCCITFPNRSQFMQHAKKKYCKQRARLVHSGDYPFKAYQHYQCSACETLFVHKLFLLTHITNLHNPKEFPTTCYVCGEMFDTKNEYKDHTQSSTCFIKLYCSICKHVFDNQTEFDNHSKIHDFEPVHDSLNGFTKVDVSMIKQQPVRKNVQTTSPISCHICSRKYATYRGLLMHMTEGHKNYKLKRCKICRKRFIFKNDIQVHMLTEHHQSKEIASNNFSCVQCGEQFPTLDKWCEHQQTHTDSVHQCEDCSKVFISEEELKDHKSTAHSNIKLKLYRCSDSNSYKTVSSFEDTEDETTKLDDCLFKCDQCDCTYRVRASLMKHRRLKHGLKVTIKARSKSNKLSCGFCKKKFTNNASLVLHKRHIHHRNNGKIIETDPEDSNSVFPHSCNVCSKSFPTIKALSIHAKSHATSAAKLTENPNVAASPEKYLIKAMNMDAPENIAAPIKVEMVEPVENRTCDICEDVFRTIGEYQKHAKTHSKKKKKAKRCLICRKKYIRLESHMRQSHNVKTQPKKGYAFCCTQCSATFQYQSHLTKHMEQHATKANINKTVYKCQLCPKVCITSFGLTSHMKRVHEHCENDDESKPFKCKLCPKSFLTLQALGKHCRRTHTDQKVKYEVKEETVSDGENYIEEIILNEVKKESTHVTYQCKHCDKNFSRPGLWRTHMFKAHPTMKIKKFTCTQCNKIFPSQLSLTRHLKIFKNSKMHIKYEMTKSQTDKENNITAQIKPEISSFKCKLCKMVLLTESNYKRHIAWHKRKMGVTIPCPICNESFKTANALIIHNRANHREGTCKYCNRSFSQQHHLKRHLESKHARELKRESRLAGKIKKAKKAAMLETKLKLKEKVNRDNDSDTVKPVQTERVYSCTACNMTFLNANKLRLHVTKTHNMALTE